MITHDLMKENIFLNYINITWWNVPILIIIIIIIINHVKDML